MRSPEEVSAVFASGIALIVLVRLFLWKRGLPYSLFAAGVAWVTFFVLAYVILVVITASVGR